MILGTLKYNICLKENLRFLKCVFENIGYVIGGGYWPNSAFGGAPPARQVTGEVL